MALYEGDHTQLDLLADEADDLDVEDSKFKQKLDFIEKKFNKIISFQSTD